MKLDFVAQSSRNSGFAAASQERLINWYPEALPSGARAGYQLRSVLGTSTWAELGGVFLRALATVNETCYAVTNGFLWEIASNAAQVSRGAVIDSAETTIAGNDGNVTVVAGGTYYVWDGATFTQPTPGAFSSFGSVDTLGGYTLLTEKDGNRLQWSALLDAKTLSGLNFATMEQHEGNILRVVVINGNAVVFKGAGYEVWGLTGQSGANALSWLGVSRQIGLKSYGLVAKTRAGAFFVGTDNRLYLLDGVGAEPFSSPKVEYDIANGEPTECFYYEDEGHQFAVVRFRNRPAWVCDLSQGGAWHERATGDGAWKMQHATYVYGGWKAGGQGGDVYRLTRNNMDVSGDMIRVAVSMTLEESAGFSVSELRFFGNVGEHDLGREPQMLVEVSRDNGKTWGKIRSVGLGDLGEYRTRARVKALGRFESLTSRLTITEPVDIRLLSSAELVTG